MAQKRPDPNSWGAKHLWPEDYDPEEWKPGDPDPEMLTFRGRVLNYLLLFAFTMGLLLAYRLVMEIF